MGMLTKIGLRLSLVAEGQAKRGEFLSAAKLYIVASRLVQRDIGSRKKLLKRLEEE